MIDFPKFWREIFKLPNLRVLLICFEYIPQILELQNRHTPASAMNLAVLAEEKKSAISELQALKLRIFFGGKTKTCFLLKKPMYRSETGCINASFFVYTIYIYIHIIHIIIILTFFSVRTFVF